MNQEFVNAPAARSWRDIPQPVKPRAMSRGGRWRLLMAGVRTTAVGILIGSLAWGAWTVSAAFRKDSRAMPDAAKAVPVRSLELQTSLGGVLDGEWLARTLALPENVSLMELDLEKLRARLLNEGQVLTATIERRFPDTLMARITERTPVARVKVEFGSDTRELLVARDGVVFAGSGFERALLDTLPWLAGTALAREGAWFRPIGGLDVVSDLLLKAQDEAPHLYASWHIVSLERLASDHELDVITKRGSTVVFNARGSFFTQLARLDSILERLAVMPAARARIDLSLGREVPVMIEPLAGAEAKARAAARPATTPIFSVFPQSQSKTKREL